MNDELGFKELYEVFLKTTLPIEVGGILIEPNETIAYFDKIQIANFQEIKNTISTNGGYGNRPQIFWESTKEIKINLIQGIFSKKQLALMSNAHLIKDEGKQIIQINTREEKESDEYGRIAFKNKIVEPIFVYDSASGKKVKDWILEDKSIILKEPYKSVVVDYHYEYNNGFSLMTMGRPLANGYLSLIGKMRVKDDITGKVKTGIIKIPKLRLMSDLSIRVGSDAIPQVGRLDAVAVPEGVRGQSKVMEIIFLNDDIDADM